MRSSPRSCRTTRSMRVACVREASRVLRRWRRIGARPGEPRIDGWSSSNSSACAVVRALLDKKTAEPLRAPPFLLFAQRPYEPRSSARQLHRSVHPLDPVARVTISLRASLYGLLASTRSPTSDEPRDQPARPEAQPNQRLYEPLGSPPSVAVGWMTARAAHRSRAPEYRLPLG